MHALQTMAENQRPEHPVGDMEALKHEVAAKPRRQAWVYVTDELYARLNAAQNLRQELGIVKGVENDVLGLGRCRAGPYVEYVSYASGYETPDEWGWDCDDAV